MDFVISDVHYHVEKCGEGFPIILLHGFTGSRQSWQRFCTSIGRQSTMYMVDLIGHGKTESPDLLHRYDIKSVASDLNEIMNELGLEKADILGYSMGGRVAITFAALYPERVNRLILESTTPGIEESEKRTERIAQDERLATLIETDGLSSFISFWEGISIFETQRNLPVSIRERIREQRLKNSTRGLAYSLRGMGTGSQPSWWNHIERFPFQTLIMTGEMDEKFCRIAKEMMKKLKKGQWVIIHGCGHTIHVEDPEKFGTIVSEFLSNT